MSNPNHVQQFAQRLLTVFTDSILTQMIDIGYRTGLFEASSQGAATSEELSERAGLHERYVREWLGAMTTGGIYRYDPETRRYTLPAEHAALLTGDSARNLGPIGLFITQLGQHVPALTECFRDGGGVPYSAYQPEFTQAMDDAWHRIYDEQLVDGFLGRFPDLTEALENGIRILDIGCGTGHAVNVLAQAYPNSTVIGYDLAEDAIEQARKEAGEMGLSNATFEVMDAASIPTTPPFELIMAFGTVHHLTAPGAVLDRIRDALAADGAFLMIEYKFSSEVHENIGNPFAPMMYGVSLLHCTPVSLADGGPGLGAVMGQQTAREMLANAGFRDIIVEDTPRPQNYMFLCRP